ncbi:cutinase family protein [Mycobacterium sp. NBC_00419]|uniref:cutinase family protein n=1 Tax=Mycobacterium sp. NBC_00419 TaxID=2975989 RepID=UPI002E1FF526
MKLPNVLFAVAAAASALLVAPQAQAADCPDINVVFARGTWEPPGVGNIGQAFVDAVTSDAAGKSVSVYPVNYPASTDFQRAVDGVMDASNHIRAMALDCPKTKMVLGGYSQGAAVMGFVTANAVPDGFVAPAGLTGPMPNDIADHVAAIALFGKPSTGFLNTIGAPPIAIGPLYAAKTIDMCLTDDPICSDGGGNGAAHGMYAANGMVGQAAQFAVKQAVAV